MMELCFSGILLGTRRYGLFLALLFFFSGLSPASGADTDPPKRGLLERITHPDTKAKSAFQDKVYSQGPSFASKTFSTSGFETGKPRAEKSFLAGSFNGVKEALFGKKTLPSKELSERYLKKDPMSGKTFSTGSYSTRSYADAGRSSSEQRSFETREISLKGKTQGALDNDPKLESAIRKGLSIDDVRNLLNKGP